MKKPSQLISIIFQYLNTNTNYAVLRNYKGLPINNISRDIDILIEKKEFQKIEQQIFNIISALDFKIVTYYRSEKITTYVCGQVNTEGTDLVQFDFFFNTSLFGFIILDIKNVLDSKLFNGSVYHVSKEYEFLDKYLQTKYLKKEYPEKYQSLKDEILNSPLLTNILMEIIGVSKLTELESMSTWTLKRKLFSKNFKKTPLKHVSLLYQFAYYYLKNRITYKGFSIGFTGPDGTGKTTIITKIVEGMAKTYSAIDLFHFRPSLIPNIGEAAQKTKLKTNIDKDFSNPHRGGKTGELSSFLRLLYYSTDYFLGYFLKIRPNLERRSIVIFDRYYTDLVADNRRSRIFLNHKFLYWFGKLFIPKLDYNILLTADRDVILKRKQELTAEGIDDINKKLDYLAAKKSYFLVENNGEPNEAIQKVLTHIFEKQHLKNYKRINR